MIGMYIVQVNAIYYTIHIIFSIQCKKNSSWISCFLLHYILHLKSWFTYIISTRYTHRRQKFYTSNAVWDLPCLGGPSRRQTAPNPRSWQACILMEKRPQINFSHLVENIYLKLCPVMSSNVHPYIHYCNCPEVKKNIIVYLYSK